MSQQCLVCSCLGDCMCVHVYVYVCAGATCVYVCVQLRLCVFVGMSNASHDMLDLSLHLAER